MTGGFMTSAVRLPLFAAAGFLLLGGTSAEAADLGGNCCADLEERIAELEATTARKGNRKVSLQISGQVNEAVIFWDDGGESNVGVYTNDAARTRFRFRGDAKINSDWKAGYLLEIGVRANNSKRFTQDNPSPVNDNGLDLRHSVWYLDSKTFGRVWVGLTGGAGESVTEVNLAGTGDVAKFSDAEDLAGGLFLRLGNGTLSNIQIRRLIRDSGNQPGEGRRFNMVRYDTPEIFGFTGTVNWGADDTWEIGLRYKGEFGGFKLAGAIAYGETSEPPVGTMGFECVGNNAVGANIGGTGKDADCQQFGGSISVQHVASGIYVNLAAGFLEDDLIDVRAVTAGDSLLGAPVDDRHEFWAIEAGIQQKWIPLGATTIFGQYYHNDGGTTFRNYGSVVNPVHVINSELNIYSVGVMQELDSAAMKLYAIYRHVEADATVWDTTTATVGTLDFQDVDLFMAGAVIRF